MSTPEQIQRDIEGTRRALSDDVDRLTEKVSPGRVVSRRVDRVKSGAASIRERVMGTLPDPQQVKSSAGEAAGSGISSAKGAVGNAASTVGDAASTVGEAVTGAPQTVKQQTQGNPLGAGLVAFGLGLVISSLVPATDREKQLAAQAQDKAAGPLQEKAMGKAKEMAGQMQGSVQQSAEQVKEVAAQGASQTMEEARSAAGEVKEAQK